MALILVTKKFLQKRWNKTKAGPDDQQGGYNLEPWRQSEAQAGFGQNTTVTGGPTEQSYPAAVQPDMRSYANYQSNGGHKLGDMGPQQSTRECV